MILKNKILLLGLVVLIVMSLFSCGKREIEIKDFKSENLIGVAELEELLSKKAVVLIDSRSASDFERYHIPGAINLPKIDLRTPSDLEYKNKSGFAISAKRATQLFTGIGISTDSDVVVYDSIAYPDASIYWSILTYYGHKRVKVLKGGFEEWVRARRPLASGKESYSGEAGNFIARPQNELVASTEWLRDNLDDVVIIDLRSLSEFMGINSAGNKRGGSIPGAIHLEWSELAGNETIKTREELEAVLERYQIPSDKTIVTYCNFGIGRSTYGFMVLKLLGYQDVRVYGGSMEDWAAREELPVATSSTIPRN